MDSATRRRLQEMTAAFYHAHAESFDESRQGGWDAWKRVLDKMQTVRRFNEILDLGCGNGRFADFLQSHESRAISYRGVDSEPSFITFAQDRYPTLAFDVDTLEHTLETSQKVDAIVSFGVLHHIPGHQQRIELLQGMHNALKPGGVAAISFWQPKRLRSFESKVLLDHDMNDLEPDDYLLGWKGDFSTMRYCHHFEDDEIVRLVEQTSFGLHDRFHGTGNDASNCYVIVSKSPANSVSSSVP
jgi:tRNA (uracil-5-)-methyltransferase TRM9